MACLLAGVLGGFAAVAFVELVAYLCVSRIPADEQDDGW